LQEVERGAFLPVPELEIMPTSFELFDEQSSMIALRSKQTRNTKPGRGNSICKTFHTRPVIVEPKDRRLRNCCNCSEDKLTVIRNSSRGRGKSRVGEAETPFSVNKEPVKTYQNRNLLMVGPSEASVEQGELLQSHSIQRTIEPVRLQRVKITIGAVVRRSDEVEVSKKYPWARYKGLETKQLIQECLIITMQARTIAVGHSDSEIRASGLEDGCQGVSCVAGGGEVEAILVPRGKNTSRGTI